MQVVKIALVLGLIGTFGAAGWQATRQAEPTPSAASGNAAGTPPAPATDGVPVYAANVVGRFPHDTGAFTEGLLFCDGALYESTGKEGASDIRRVNLADGKVIARARIEPGLFGEGIGCWNKGLTSVTWKTGIGFRWTLPALKKTGKPIRYAGEGWALTSDGRALILSDGTPTLRLMDPTSFAERGRIAVTLNGRPLQKLNELEYVKGRIFANVWMTGFIARIDPATGKVDGLIDLRPLAAEVGNADPDAVPNGIAYDAAADRLYVTGKYWPTLYQITLGEEVGRAR